MKNVVCLTWAFVMLIVFDANSQVTPPCPTPPPPGAESCPTTCVYCDFDGYMGINNGTPSGGNTVCGQIAIHNDQWFGFVAGTTNLTINIATSNCQNGDGLQAAFFENCTDDAIVCNPGGGGGGGQPLELTYTNFVPGQTYYLMIDGWVGDVCNYEIQVLDGSITPPPPTQPAVPQGPSHVCPGGTAVYSIPDVSGAGYYFWSAPAGSSINGGGNTANLPAPDGTSVTVTFGTQGGQICVRAGNACFAPLQSCLPIINQPIPPTQLAQKVVCFDDLPYIWEEEPHIIISVAGTYNLMSTPYDSYLGCDSTVKQTVKALAQIKTNLNTIFVCEGTCFNINGNSYCETGGPFQEIFESYLGCDSVVSFNVLKVPSNANIQPVIPIDCNNPTITLNSSGSTTGPLVTYKWTNITWNPLGTGQTQNISAGGTYHLVVTNQAGTGFCRDTATVVVVANTAPPGATAVGGAINCVANTVQLTGSSPTTGVNYQWSGPDITIVNQNLQNPVVSLQGAYSLTVTNPATGCTSVAITSVVADQVPPLAGATGGAITCTQPTITIDGTSNAASAAYNWSGPGINAGNQTLENPPVTVPGNYLVTVTNTVNGCTGTANTTVSLNTAVPIADAGADQLITCTQPNVTLNGSGQAGGVPLQYSWSGPGITTGNQSLSTPSVNVDGTYILLVTNTQNGCSSQDTVVVNANIVAPVADAGLAPTITCVNPTVTIDGSGSSQGGNYAYNWSGPGINAGNQSAGSPSVSLAGNYTLTVTNNQNGCTATSTVAVAINTTPPVAGAGIDQTLTCSSPSGVTLQGSGSPANITYSWTGAGIGVNNFNLATPTVTQPDTYVLVVTDPANGCTAFDQVIVMQDANVPTADAGPDLVLNCAVSAVDIDGSGSSVGGTFSYNWAGPGINAGNATVQSPTGINLPGTYTVTVTNSLNNCINTDIIVVTIDTVHPVVLAGPSVVLNCLNGQSDTLNTAGSSAGANFDYTWTGSGITPANEHLTNPVVTQPGVYQLVITNTQNACSATSQTTATLNITPPLANAGTDQIIDCVVTATSIGGSSSSGPFFSYLWSGPGINAGNENAAQPSVAQAGTYTVVVTNSGNGCTSSDEVVVTSNAVYPVADAGAGSTLTCAQPAYQLNASASSSGPNFQIQWSGPGINAGNQNSANPQITLPGSYVLTITDTQNSCTAQDTVVVDLNKTIPAVAAPTTLALDCQTTSVILDGAGSSTGVNIAYAWSGPGLTALTGAQISPSITGPGVFTLVVTDTQNGCTSSAQTTVSQNITAPVANAGLDKVVTCGQPIQTLDGISSSSGANMSYVWTGPGINTGNFNVLSPMVADSGSYILIVTNTANHCTATDFVFVNEDKILPIVAAGPDKTLTCALTTVTLDGQLSQSGSNISYLWSGIGIVPAQATMPTPSVSQPGVYNLVVTNTTNGCSNTDAVNVGEDVIPPTADAGTDLTLTCANSTSGVILNATASSSGAQYTLLWTGPGITAANQHQTQPTVLVTGIYTVSITNTQNGCTAVDDVSVIQDQNLPTPNAGADQTITCSTLIVTLDGSGSTSPGGAIQYNWSGPGINAGNQHSDMVEVTAAGMYTLTVLNPLTGCQASDNVQVLLDNQPPQVTMKSDTITCDEPQGNLSVQSGIPGCTYSWEGLGITAATQNLASLQVGEPGVYTVTVTAPNGCTTVQSVLMAVSNDFPEGTAEGALLNCLNNGSATVSANVSTPGATYRWLRPNGAVISTGLTATVTQPGTYQFEITAPNGCVRLIPVQVLADFAQPNANAVVLENLDCNTTALTIQTAGSSVGAIYTYSWTTSGGNIVSGASGLSPVVDEPGFYQLLVSNNINGCKDSITVEVKNDPSVPVAFELNIRDLKCHGDKNGSISILDVQGGTEPFSFSIDGNSGTAPTQFTGLSADTYTIHLEDANGCLLDSTVAITDPGVLSVSLGDDQEVQLGESVTVAAQLTHTTPLASIVWNYSPNCDSLTDCTEFSYVPLKSYEHRIVVTDSNGCKVNDAVLIAVKKDRLVFIPNIFKPASDEPINAILMIQGGIGVAKIHSWRIYDRWGDQVFSVTDFLPNDQAFAWSGKVRGADGLPGVYTWFAEIEFIDGVTELYKGDVTLFR